MIEYTVDKSALIEKAVEEISHVLKRAYSEEGVSVYDSVYPTFSDRNTLSKAIDTAIGNISVRMNDITRHEAPDLLLFNVPDFDMGKKQFLLDAITEYAINSTCHDWFTRYYAVKAEEYASRCKSSMDRIVALAKTRQKPIWT